MSNKDIVNHPSHYCDGRKYEPIDVISDWGLPFTLANTVKYISRAGRKDDYLQDLEKAAFYLNYEIEKIKAEREDNKEDYFDIAAVVWKDLGKEIINLYKSNEIKEYNPKPVIKKYSFN